jgi:hypothetical protein
MIIQRVISGGQTGADQAGWRAAKAFSIPCSGWMPKGFLTEDGPRPEFAELYGAKEHPSDQYAPRTRSNVELSTCVFVFGNGNSPGSRLTISTADDQEVPCFVIRDPISPLPHELVEWALKWSLRSLMVAGNRESKSPGIGTWVEAYLAEVFRLLGCQQKVNQ